MLDFTYNHWTLEVMLLIREQFPLPLETTLEIAKKIGIPHPADRRKNPVVMTTDFLVTVSTPSGNVDWARAIKPSSQLQKQRVIEKLEIERIYWQTNNISWGIVTEREMPRILVKNIDYLLWSFWQYEIIQCIKHIK
jgi:hypothetical protein